MMILELDLGIFIILKIESKKLTFIFYILRSYRSTKNLYIFKLMSEMEDTTKSHLKKQSKQIRMLLGFVYIDKFLEIKFTIVCVNFT